MANAFCGHPNPPARKELDDALGKAKALWERMLSCLADDLGPIACEWGSSSPSLGWSLRVKRGGRIIVYLAPLQGCFRASFALGDKAVKTALAANLPEQVVKTIQGAKRYAEGTAVRIEVKSPDDLTTVRIIAAAKSKN